MNETVSLEVAIEVVLRNGPTFETIAGLCKMAVEAEREKVAAWMMARGYATGHGDTIEDLLNELEWQIREQEREACAKVVENLIPEQTEDGLIGHTIAKAIREARRLPPYTTPPVQEFVCSTGFCHFTLTQTNIGIGERKK